MLIEDLTNSDKSFQIDGEARKKAQAAKLLAYTVI